MAADGIAQKNAPVDPVPALRALAGKYSGALVLLEEADEILESDLTLQVEIPAAALDAMRREGEKIRHLVKNALERSAYVKQLYKEEES